MIKDQVRASRRFALQHSASVRLRCLITAEAKATSPVTDAGSMRSCRPSHVRTARSRHLVADALLSGSMSDCVEKGFVAPGCHRSFANGRVVFAGHVNYGYGNPASFRPWSPGEQIMTGVGAWINAIAIEPLQPG